MAITPSEIKNCLNEIDRFTIQAKDLLDQIEEGLVTDYKPSHSRAALRRASLDLSRALVKLRRS